MGRRQIRAGNTSRERNGTRPVRRRVPFAFKKFRNGPEILVEWIAPPVYWSELRLRCLFIICLFVFYLCSPNHQSRLIKTGKYFISVGPIRVCGKCVKFVGRSDVVVKHACLSPYFGLGSFIILLRQLCKIAAYCRSCDTNIWHKSKLNDFFITSYEQSYTKL